MYAFELCRRYQDAINAGQLGAVMALFEPGATITTPLAGTLGVEEYHRRLLGHTRQTISRLLNVFEGLNGAPSVALYLQHTLIMASGKSVEFTAIDVYQFSADRQRFISIHILYDSAPVRAQLTREQLAGFTLGTDPAG